MAALRWCLLSSLSLLYLAQNCQGQITLSVQPDVTSNVNICQNTTVEFTCVANEVAVQMWRENGNEILTFTPSSPTDCTEDFPPFTACLTINTGSTSNNYRSTLTVQSISDLQSGDVIECLDDEASLQSINVSYTLIDTPSQPSPTLNVTTTQDETASIALTFDRMDFVDEYRVAASGDERVNCPSTCSPNSTCECTGLVAGDDIAVSLTITAVNCDTQEGPAYNVTITPRVPAAPSSCWILPVFSATEMGPRTGVVASWRNVLNPRNLTNKLSQDVLNYTVSIVETVIGVPVNIACTMNSTCWTDLTSYYDEASNSSVEVRVAATNIFGNGPSKDCQLPPNRSISPTNTLFNVDVIESGRTVQCNVLDQGLDNNFVCQFCYGLDDCEGSLTCVNVTTVTTTPLRDVTDGTTYCYRVIGFQDGVPVALIQDTFTVLLVPSQSWIIPLLSISIILCIVHCAVLAIAVIISIWIFRSSKPPNDSDHEYTSTSKRRRGICLVTFLCVLGVVLMVSIILLITYGATINGSTVAGAFVLSAIALIPSIIIIVLVAISLYKSGQNYPVTDQDGDNQPHRTVDLTS